MSTIDEARKVFLAEDLPDNWEKCLIREKLIRQQHQIDVEDLSRHSYTSGQWSNHRPVRTLMSKVLPDIIKTIELLESSMKYDYSAKHNKTLIVRLLSENYETYAYLALLTMFNLCTKNSTFGEIYAEIARACEEDAKLNYWKSANLKLFDAILKRQRKNTTREAWQKVGLSVAMNRYADGKYINPDTGEKEDHPEAKWTPWPIEYKRWLARTLFAIIISTTRIFDIAYNKYSKYTRTANAGYRLRPTQQLLEWIADADKSLGLNGGYYLPIPIPPRPWTDTQNGGYWTIYAGQSSLVKSMNKAYQQEILNLTEQFQQVFAAVNAAQNTAWRINSAVYDVIKTLVYEGRPIAGLPSAEKLPLPRCPKCGQIIGKDEDHPCLHNPVLKTQWKGLARAIYRQNIKAIGQRLRLAMIMETAELLLDDDAFYYVYELDFRGRLYPKTNLSPQGTDMEKGMLEFAKGVPLGKHGAKWLAVHIANCWGNDKVDYPERVAWVKNNEQWILECGKSPLDRREWTEADSPFMFLAACMEWYKMHESGDTEHFISHLPIGLDGSCSGIQHYSALLKDKTGALATNVITRPDQKRKADIYGLVAEQCKKKFTEDIAGENPVAAKYAMFIMAHDMMNRKIVKRAVMTLPYGSAFSSCLEYTTEALNEVPAVSELDEKDLKQFYLYVANAVWKAIPKVVVAPRIGMQFLKQTARLAVKSSAPVTWVAPTGFVVTQDYYLPDVKWVKTALGGKIGIHDGVKYWQPDTNVVKINIMTLTPLIDEARQVSGIAPNFIHSLDASHLIFSVNAAVKTGMDSFALVHDSLGVHAGRTEEFFDILRQQFYHLYHDYNPLKTFLQNILPLISEEDRKKIPLIPDVGTLELSCILKSKYLFS